MHFLKNNPEFIDWNQLCMNECNQAIELLMSNIDKQKYLIDNNLIDKYELNKKLVDLTEIPENLIINFNNKYNIINK